MQEAEAIGEPTPPTDYGPLIKGWIFVGAHSVPKGCTLMFMIEGAFHPGDDYAVPETEGDILKEQFTVRVPDDTLSRDEVVNLVSEYLVGFDDKDMDIVLENIKDEGRAMPQFL